MRVEDGRVRLAGKWVQVVPEHVAAALTSATRWLTAMRQATAAELSSSDFAHDAQPDRVMVRRTAKRRVLDAADAAWRLAGQSVMPAPWRAGELADRVRALIAVAGTHLGEWRAHLSWWLQPGDLVRPELAKKLATILAAIERGADRVVIDAVEKMESIRTRSIAQCLAAKRAAIAAVGPPPAPTRQERDAIIALARHPQPPKAPQREECPRRVLGGKYVAIWNVEEEKWSIWTYHKEIRMERRAYESDGHYAQAYIYVVDLPIDRVRGSDIEANGAAEAEASFDGLVTNYRADRARWEEWERLRNAYLDRCARHLQTAENAARVAERAYNTVVVEEDPLAALLWEADQTWRIPCEK